MAYNASYAQIAPRLEPQHRRIFARYQEDLTPLLATADPGEWKSLLEDFQNALPHVSEIFRHPERGPVYGYVYMLHRNLVQMLMQQGLEETEAIEFVAVNAGTIRTYWHGDNKWVAYVLETRRHDAPDGKSVFQWMCADPALFWVAAKDGSEGKRHSLEVLRGYAGTDLPAILTKYAKVDDDTLQAAISALAQYDHEQDPDEDKAQPAAHFLDHYQNDPSSRSS